MREKQGLCAGMVAALHGAMRLSVANVVRWLFPLAFVLGAAACQVGEPVDDMDDQVQEDRLSDPSLVIDEESAPSAGEGEIASSYCPGCSNCVYRARCLQPRLPTGLTTWSDKLGKINSHTPRVGCVAMIYTGSQWGHAAFVADKHADGTLTLKEGNWISGQCSQRRGTPSHLNIRGYWCP
jgi:hypothetical protein